MPISLKSGEVPVSGYTLEEQLGRGGFGEVWKATAPGGFHVAMKFVRTDSRQVDFELRALETVREIRHPHLLDIQFALQVECWLVVAMPLCDRSLSDRLRECQLQMLPGIPSHELLGYMKETAKALDYLNEQRHRTPEGSLVGIQHRDIKPQNIFLVGESVRVGDFGLAKILASSMASHTGSMTPLYVAPEMIRGKVAQQSDQYSLAVTYCELRSGKTPFNGSVHEIMYGHLEGQPDLSSLPAHERSIVGRALSKDPQQRWQNCRLFIDRLERTIVKHGSGQPPYLATTTPSDSDDPQDRVLPRPVREPIHPDVAPHRAQQQMRARRAAPPPPPPLPIAQPSRDTHHPGETAEIQPATASGGAAMKGLLSSKLFWGVLASGACFVFLVVVAVALMLIANGPSDSDVAAVPDVSDPSDASKEAPAPSTVVTNSIAMKLMVVPSGEFLMGSGESLTQLTREFGREATTCQNEFPQHRVTISKPFLLGTREVTLREFRTFVDDARYVTDAERSATGGSGFDVTRNIVRHTRGFNWRNTGFTQADDHPVVNVSWNDAVEFCKWLSQKEGVQYRLPTEAEWEYACRAGTTTRFWSGLDVDGLVSVANARDATHLAKFGLEVGTTRPDGFAFTSPVGSFLPNPFGLYDMNGNVCEWCADYYDADYYRNSPRTDPTGPSGGNGRVLRGGSYLRPVVHSRSSARMGATPRYPYGDFGFRVARSLP